MGYNFEKRSTAPWGPGGTQVSSQMEPDVMHLICSNKAAAIHPSVVKWLKCSVMQLHLF